MEYDHFGAHLALSLSRNSCPLSRASTFPKFSEGFQARPTGWQHLIGSCFSATVCHGPSYGTSIAGSRASLEEVASSENSFSMVSEDGNLSNSLSPDVLECILGNLKTSGLPTHFSVWCAVAFLPFTFESDWILSLQEAVPCLPGFGGARPHLAFCAVVQLCFQDMARNRAVPVLLQALV